MIDTTIIEEIMDVANEEGVIKASSIERLAGKLKKRDQTALYKELENQGYTVENDLKNISASDDSKSVNILSAYINECAQYKLLNQNEEFELFARYKKGDEEARTKLINSNLRLVIAIAKKRTAQGLELLDLIQEGNIGLIDAVEHFNPDMNVRFSTYACYWIRMRINKSLKEKTHSIRIPVHVLEKLSLIGKVKAQFAEENDRAPTLKELSHLTGISEQSIIEMEAAPSCDTILDAPSNDETESSILTQLLDREQLSVEDETEKRDDVAALIQAISQLPCKERFILAHHYGFEMDGVACPQETLLQIGDKLQLTKERVRQLEEDAQEKVQMILALRFLPPNERYVIAHCYGFGCEPENFQEIGDGLQITESEAIQLEQSAIDHLHTQLDGNE